jgi:ABC-type multidrug transport system ATPase subunit
MKEIRNLIVRLSTEMKKTILLSSHILSEVEIVASRMIIINKGKTIVEGSVSDLLNAAQSEVMFRVSDTERALALLTKYTLSKPTVVTDSISISIRNENISELNALFVRNGIDVQAIIPKRSLEEYFLRITEGKE